MKTITLILTAIILTFSSCEKSTITSDPTKCLETLNNQMKNNQNLLNRKLISNEQFLQKAKEYEDQYKKCIGQ